MELDLSGVMLENLMDAGGLAMVHVEPPMAHSAHHGVAMRI